MIALGSMRSDAPGPIARGRQQAEHQPEPAELLLHPRAPEGVLTSVVNAAIALIGDKLPRTKTGRRRRRVQHVLVKLKT